MLYQLSVHLSLLIGFSHTGKRHITNSRTLSPPVVSHAFELTAKRVSVARRYAHLLLHATTPRRVKITRKTLGLDFVEGIIAVIGVGEHKVMAVNFAVIVNNIGQCTSRWMTPGLMKADMALCVDEVCLLIWLQLCDKTGLQKIIGLERVT